MLHSDTELRRPSFSARLAARFSAPRAACRVAEARSDPAAGSVSRPLGRHTATSVTSAVPTDQRGITIMLQTRNRTGSFRGRPLRGMVLLLMVTLAAEISPAAAEAAVVKFSATLRGADMAPRTADPDGRGTVELRVDTRAGTVCQVLRLSRVQHAQIANIRAGWRGKAGPIVVDLDLFGAVTRSCTTSVPEEDLRALIRHPGRFHVLVTSERHPRGAVRGQLRRVSAHVGR